MRSCLLAVVSYSLRYVKENCESAYHPCGTCRMGEDEGSVVDSECRVHGIEGLRVVDSSIMPQVRLGIYVNDDR